MKTLGLTLCLSLTALCGRMCPAAESAGRDEPIVDGQSERLINGALKFLASQQLPNGAWEPDNYPVAFTGYAMIAFMAAGQLPDEGRYGTNVSEGMSYLLRSTAPDGYISTRGPGGSSNMYAHGIATIALAELYGQTRNSEIRPKLSKAVRLIVNCQGDTGGWSYAPRKNQGADISQTVMQVTALRAAKNAGLDVPQETIDRAIAFVKSCYDVQSGGFKYMPRSGPPGYARTAAAIYSLQVCGRYDDPAIKTGSAYLFEHAGHNDDQDTNHFVYGVFYAAPAQYMIGGETWKRWYRQTSSQLKKSAVPAAGGGVYWPPAPFSAIYTTSVYTTVLAIPYHYLPLYQR